MFDSWNYLKGTKNDVYRRWLFLSSIYRVKKWNVKFAPFFNLPAANCRLSRSALNRQIYQQTSVVTISSIPKSDPIF